MADKDGKCDLAIAPGQVYVEVEYDYEYKAKDRLITIKQGECYILLKKTNEDWWQVKKDENTKPFYVPAQYVREVRKALMPPQKPLHSGALVKAKPNMLDIHPLQKSNENLAKAPEMTSFGRPAPGPVTPPAPPRDANQNLGSPVQSKSLAEHFLNNNNISGAAGSLPGVRADSPPPPRPPNHSRSPAAGRKPPLDLEADRTPPHCDSAGEGSEKHRQDSESGDELSSSSTEHLQTASPTGPGRPESPVYTNLQELKISQAHLPPAPSGSPLHTLGDWETYKDPSGRHFYFNRATQERTWKPPRARDASSSGSTGSSRGEAHAPGDPEWIKHVDDQGRPYYYSADGSRSEWELPKYNLSPPQPGDMPKSRSLDRKQVEPIVLTKWRHSTYVADLSDKTSEKCGVLNVTKITENGKKVRKNWTSSWAVLQGFALLFAKGQGGGTGWFGGNQSKPEFTVDLRGASVDWASKDKSSKKHVIELKTRQGTELLIQSENDSVITDWYKALAETISTHAWESDEAIEEDMPESPRPEKQDKDKEKDKEKDKDKEHRDSKKGRVMKTSTSMDSSDQKKTRVKLRKFLTRRPTLQAVRDKGYIKDQVFGCSLTSLCQRENTTVPNFVKMCIDHVENKGLSVDGLYRVSGNLAVIQKLRFAVNHDEKVNLEDSKWEDIHVTTGALKMFFRELPEPLFTHAYFEDFVSAIKCPDYKQRVHSIKDLIKQLPKPNQDTMQVLFKHLRRVIDNGELNRMTTQSVAIVFGPTLLRPEKETGNIAVHMVYQNQIVELILLEYESIFSR
ncbi:rho GTPase-activating protein 12b isoform X15 [Lepisosteus oculatus]|uniref:rho GTPase-activating protein 12b isoform X15 n=1 Tax=Lepisosteus oculatus TaxID=7918 RepID=UPI00371ECFB5